MCMQCFCVRLCPFLFPWAMVCSSPWRGPLHHLLIVFYSLCSNCEWQFILDLALCLSILVHRNACDFCILILYPETLLKLLITLRRFWAETIGICKYTVMSSANRDNLTFSFPNWISLISFSSLIALARTSNSILNRSGEKGYPCLLPDFKECFLFLPI